MIFVSTGRQEEEDGAWDDEVAIAFVLDCSHRSKVEPIPGVRIPVAPRGPIRLGRSSVSSWTLFGFSMTEMENKPA
jgi:hypothetical protein